MSAKTASPTANILRNSRLFSLPPPLARAKSRRVRISDSATQPYPTQQAIATTHASRARGDWGLKRSLPDKQLRASEPVLRVNAIDTWEHITDFESALDLTQSLHKFQELNLPITATIRDGSRQERERSVFEDDTDNTDPSIIDSRRSRHTRWKFSGPWLASMTEGDFVQYMNTILRSRKGDFTKFLRRRLRQKMESDSAYHASQTGARGQQSFNREIKVTDEELAEYIRQLRRNMTTTSELAQLIEQFLDLPAAPAHSSQLSAYSVSLLESGPPVTHPSAGLGYLRSNAFLNNHPILGPQRNAPPQPARVLAASRTAMEHVPGRMGVAGIIAKETTPTQRIRVTDSATDNEELVTNQDKEGKSIGVGVEGGNRVWVDPWRVHVRPDGRISMTVINAEKTAVGVKTGELIAPDRLAPEHRYEAAKPLDFDPAGRPLPASSGASDKQAKQSSQARRSSRTAPKLTPREAGSGYGIDAPQDDFRTKTPAPDATSSLVQDLERSQRRPRGGRR